MAPLNSSKCGNSKNDQGILVKTLTVISPVYCEAEVIAMFHSKLHETLQKVHDKYITEIIYIVDPSPDATEAIIFNICNSNRNVNAVVMSRRFGHQAALVAGLDLSDSDIVIMLDSDLQHPPELILEMLKLYEGGNVDVIQGIRIDNQHANFLKKNSSKLFYKFFQKIAGQDLKSGAADYRLLSKKVVALFQNRIRERNQFLRGLVSWVGFNTVDIEFECSQRGGGETNYSFSRLLNFAFEGLFSFSKVPLRISMIVGLLVAFIGFLYGASVISLHLIGGINIPGWSSLLIVATLIGGIQLIFLGVIGEYIGLIFDEVKHRPIYLIDKSYGAKFESLGNLTFMGK